MEFESGHLGPIVQQYLIQIKMEKSK